MVMLKMASVENDGCGVFCFYVVANADNCVLFEAETRSSCRPLCEACLQAFEHHH